MATGLYDQPRSISLKGMETFTGKILHSSEYKTGKDFKGQKVLVIGFGNSACEIALDLFEQGASVAMSVRSPVNVVPRDVLGLPVQELSLLMSRLPPRVADILSAPLVRLLIGNIRKLGLQKKNYGPLEEIQKNGQAPLLDIGIIQHIRKGHIKIYGDIDYINDPVIQFKDGSKETFNAIVAAIGYNRNSTGHKGH